MKSDIYAEIVSGFLVFVRITYSCWLLIVDYTFAKQLIGILQYIKLWTNNQLYLIGFLQKTLSVVPFRRFWWMIPTAAGETLWKVCCSRAGLCMYFLFPSSICYQCMFSSSHLVTSPRLMARKLVITLGDFITTRSCYSRQFYST